MKFVVFGTGGVGGYFGGGLGTAGEDVVFIARGEHLQAIRSKGLRVDSIKGNFVIDPANATDQISEVGMADVILMAVKAWQVPQVAKMLSPMIGPHTFVVPMENGVEAPLQLSQALGREHVLGGLCRIFSLVAAPGHIRHAGVEPVVAFGELNKTKSERVEQLRQAFTRAGVVAEVPDDIHVAMWEKFMFIAPV